MPIVDSILSELGREALTTRKVLSVVPDGELAYRPHPRSMSLGELAWHLATIPGAIVRLASQDRVDVSQFGPGLIRRQAPRSSPPSTRPWPRRRPT